MRHTSRTALVGLASLAMIATAVTPAYANGHSQFSPSGPLDFGSQTVDTTSPSQIETITNLADAGLPLTMGAVSIEGVNAADFTIVTNQCTGQSVSGQQTCVVVVSFTPQAAGARSADLKFEFSGTRVDPPSPQVVALTGTGQAAEPQVPGPNCQAAPATLRPAGRSRLVNGGCRTSAGQRISVAATGSTRGDVRGWRIIRRPNGATLIQTYGIPLRLRITWSAPPSGDFLAYRKVKTYRT